MNPTFTEPYVWNQARWQRRLEEHSDARGAPLPNRSICICCMLPSNVVSQTRKRKWMALCEACGKRAFLHPRSLWALVGLSRDMWAAPPSDIERVVEARHLWGTTELRRIGWTERELKVRNRRKSAGDPTWRTLPVPHLAEVQACLWCGEPNSAVLRHNQLGVPQISCPSCQTIVHGVREQLVASYVGWSVWLRNELAHSPTGGAWTTYRREGKAVWLSWLPAAAGGPAAALSEAEQPQSQRRTS